VDWSYTEEEWWLNRNTGYGLESSGSEVKWKTEANLEKDCCREYGKM
jgi:hypothetical protein